MNIALRLTAAIAITALAACSKYESHAAPVSAGASPTSMPQSPNSLPLGSAVNAPLTSPTGTVGTTRVGP